jgi:hypothetical protein
MAPNPVPAVPAAAAPARKSSGLGAWVKAHKGATTGGAAIAAVLAIALYRHFSSSSSAAAQAAGSTSDTSGTQTLTPAYDSSAQDTYDALETQLNALQQQIATSSETPGTGTTGTTGTTPITGTTPVSTAGNVTVPNVEGKRTMTAYAQLQAAGLSPKVGGGFVKNSVNYVASQTPGAGAKVAKGTRVDLGSTQSKPK